MALELNTITEDGKVPSSVIEDALSARAILTTLIRDDEPNSLNRAYQQGVIDGNAPFDTQELINLGQAGRTNVNWGGAAAKIEQTLLPHYDLVMSASSYVTFMTDYGGPEMGARYGRILSEEGHRMLYDWEDFVDEVQIHQSQYVIYGIGPVFWRDSIDWRSTSLERRNVLFPSNAPARRARMELVFVRDRMGVSELFGYIKDEAVAEATKWKVDRVRNAIMNASTDENDRSRQWEWWQKQLKDNNYYYAYARTKSVDIAHCFAKEFDGTISHYIFTRNPLDEGLDGFIYENKSQFKTWSQCLCLFVNGTGNTDIKSIRGEGWQAAKFGEASNRLNNTIMDNAIQSNCVMWMAGTAADVQRFAAIEVGPNRVIPPGFTPQNIPLGGALRDAMAVASHFQLLDANHSASYNTNTVSPKTGNPRTAAEIHAEQGEKASLSSAKTERYLNDLDRYYAELFRRACNTDLTDADPGGREAKAFQKRCIERGVPKEIFKRDEDGCLVNIRSIRATRTIGSGSAAGRFMALQQISPFVLTRSPESKQKIFIQDLIAAGAGSQTAVERYGPELDEIPRGLDQWMATEENGNFMIGAPVEWSIDQNHYIHATVHISFMFAMIEEAAQGHVPAATVVMILDEGGPHTLQHIAALEMDRTRKNVVAQLKEQMSAIQQQADDVRRLAKQQERDAQEGNQEEDLREYLNLNFKDLPTDAQQFVMQKYLGFTPRGPSPIDRNLDIKERQLALKEAQTGAKIQEGTARLALDDAKTAESIRDSRHDRRMNGSKPKGSKAK